MGVGGSGGLDNTNNGDVAEWKTRGDALSPSRDRANFRGIAGRRGPTTRLLTLKSVAGEFQRSAVLSHGPNNIVRRARGYARLNFEGHPYLSANEA